MTLVILSQIPTLNNVCVVSSRNTRSSGGEVIKICLEEIDRSRPYFVCSIGFRNGWALHPLDDPKASWVTLLDNTFDIGIDAFPWVKEYRDRSVTELEILHGMLRPETRHLSPRSFVYMRSVQYLRSEVSAEQRGTYAEMGWAEQKLYDLKRSIIQAGFHIKFFDTPEQWADMVKNDFITSLDKDFPVSQFSPLDLVRHYKTTSKIQSENCNMAIKYLYCC